MRFDVALYLQTNVCGNGIAGDVLTNPLSAQSPNTKSRNIIEQTTVLIIIYLVLLYAALAGTVFLPCSSPPTLLLFFFNPFGFT